MTIVEGTVNVARRHALQIIELEKRLHIFWELPIQHFFMGYPTLMRGINWLYSFIHIPGTIAFLVWLFYYTITSNRLVQRRSGEIDDLHRGSPSGPWLYEARRRTMAICNLMAFVVFTLWPCMPPRLLSDQEVPGEIGDLARSFGFVDTVHGAEGAVSVWTANKVGTEPCSSRDASLLTMLLVLQPVGGDAIAPFWILTSRGSDDYDHTSCATTPQIEIGAAAVFQSITP